MDSKRVDPVSINPFKRIELKKLTLTIKKAKLTLVAIACLFRLLVSSILCWTVSDKFGTKSVGDLSPRCRCFDLASASKIVDWVGIKTRPSFY